MKVFFQEGSKRILDYMEMPELPRIGDEVSFEVQIGHPVALEADMPLVGEFTVTKVAHRFYRTSHGWLLMPTVTLAPKRRKR